MERNRQVLLSLSLDSVNVINVNLQIKKRITHVFLFF